MKKTGLLLTFVSIAALSSTAMAQNSANPLDRFRSDNQQSQNNNAASPISSPSRAPAIGGSPAAVPPPTVGGFQQPGLTQDQINNTLLNYNLTEEQLEEQRAEVERQSRESAFEATINGAMPLNPDEILELLDRYRDVREAKESRIGGIPDAEIVLETVSLDPGVAPSVIKLSPGHVTTLNIVDLSGQPWPIQDISWGGDFEIIQPQTGEHVVRISPMKAHEIGNLSVQLVGLNTPVVFSLRTYLEEVQYRFDAQIPEMGPNSETPLIETARISASAGGESITKILNGTPPAGTEKLDVDGVDSRTTVYNLNGQIYVRTPFSLLSPGWNSSIKSADGTAVYTIQKSPVLLLSDKGKMIRAQVDYN